MEKTKKRGLGTLPVWPLKEAAETLVCEANPSCPEFHAKLLVAVIGAEKGTDGNATIGASEGDLVPFDSPVPSAASGKRVANFAAGIFS